MLQQNKISVRHTKICMDTVVTIHVIARQKPKKIEEKIVRAFGVFRYVEAVCGRFTPESEVMRLSQQIGHPVEVSPVLFEALKSTLEAAKATNGAFDPTVGRLLEMESFQQSDSIDDASLAESHRNTRVSFLDIELNLKNRSVLLLKPLVLDLGAVIKGLAIDLAAKELVGCESFYINAGGDIFTHGLNENEEPWLVDIEHPMDPNKLIGTLHLSDGAVCTSGLSKRRRDALEQVSPIVDPKTGETPHSLLSTTVVAPSAMQADTFATAAFILGPKKGLQLLNSAKLDGILITRDFTIRSTKGIGTYQFSPLQP
ncbi:MAG TPA: FAD:protein FMN transferase [Sporolactobacillaceae bacterium]|nr:FAD:protein FMN transferase [Sporolactobacillaceae bacterium]